jgi:hypothetical protein
MGDKVARDDDTQSVSTGDSPAMKARCALALAVALILQACAGAPVAPPRIDRISAERLEARLPQPAAAMPLERIVALARDGIAAEEIIGRVAATASRYRLSAGQVVELAGQGVPLAVLDHLLADERRHIFDDMAADANAREKACQERIARELALCRSQAMQPMWFPAPHPFINCFPSPPGSRFWHCM